MVTLAPRQLHLQQPLLTQPLLPETCLCLVPRHMSKNMIRAQQSRMEPVLLHLRRVPLHLKNSILKHGKTLPLGILACLRRYWRSWPML